MDKSKYAVALHPLFPDIPYMVSYDGLELFRFSVDKLIQRKGAEYARDYIQDRLTDIFGDR